MAVAQRGEARGHAAPVAETHRRAVGVGVEADRLRSQRARALAEQRRRARAQRVERHGVVARAEKIRERRRGPAIAIAFLGTIACDARAVARAAAEPVRRQRMRQVGRVRAPVVRHRERGEFGVVQRRRNRARGIGTGRHAFDLAPHARRCGLVGKRERRALNRSDVHRGYFEPSISTSPRICGCGPRPRVYSTPK